MSRGVSTCEWDQPDHCRSAPGRLAFNRDAVRWRLPGRPCAQTRAGAPLGKSSPDGSEPDPRGVSGRGLSALSKTPERRDSAQDLSAHGAHASLGFVDITDSYPRQAIVKRHLSPRPEPRRNCSSRSAIWRTVPAGSYSSPYQAIDVPPNTWFRSAGDRAWVRDSARPTTSE
jgi:hypothetical protein